MNDDDYRRRSRHAGVEFVDLAKVRFTPDLLRAIPAELVRKYRVLPVADGNNQLAIVMSDPSDLDAVEQLQFALAKEIEMRVATESQLDSFIEELYGNEK